MRSILFRDRVTPSIRAPRLCALRVILRAPASRTSQTLARKLSFSFSTVLITTTNKAKPAMQSTRTKAIGTVDAGQPSQAPTLGIALELKQARCPQLLL